MGFVLTLPELQDNTRHFFVNKLSNYFFKGFICVSLCVLCVCPQSQEECVGSSGTGALSQLRQMLRMEVWSSTKTREPA